MTTALRQHAASKTSSQRETAISDALEVRHGLLRNYLPLPPHQPAAVVANDGPSEVDLDSFAKISQPHLVSDADELKRSCLLLKDLFDKYLAQAILAMPLRREEVVGILMEQKQRTALKLLSGVGNKFDSVRQECCDVLGISATMLFKEDLVTFVFQNKIS